MTTAANPAPGSNKARNKFFTEHQLCAFLVVSFFMLFSSSAFYINDLIAHPQFKFTDETKSFLINLVKNEGDKVDAIAYYGFFIIDCLWPALLFKLIIAYIGSVIGACKKIFAFIKGVAISAYCVDVTENILYLFYNPNGDVITIKYTLYGFVFLSLLIVLYHQHVRNHIQKILQSLVSLSISLFVILSIALLFTLMEQGTTIIVDVISHPWQLALLVVLLNVLALASSHYPAFIDAHFAGSDQVSEWKMHPEWMRTRLGMGLVTFKVKDSSGNQTPSPFDHIRNSFGTLLFLAFLYTLFFTISSLVSPRFPYNYILLGLIVGVAFLVASIAKDRDSMDSYILLKHPGEAVFYSIFATVFTWFIAIVFADWRLFSIILICLAVCINIISFIVFRYFRKEFRKWLRGSPRKAIHRLVPLEQDTNKSFIRFFAIVGYVNIAMLVIALIYPQRFNALVIFVSLLYLYYGAIMIVLKHFFYYNSRNSKGGNPADCVNARGISQYPSGKIGKYNLFVKTVFTHYLPLLLVIVLIALNINPLSKKYHKLERIELGSYTTVAEYNNDFTSKMSKLPDRPLTLIASYGGGLRANIWTMLLLEKLNQENPDFLSHVPAMSGASGGMLGEAMYLAIQNNASSPAQRSEIIAKIGKGNFLTVDVIHLFFKDLFPVGDDRSKRAMRLYADMIDGRGKQSDLITKSYSEYWHHAYTCSKQGIPALIANTSGTNDYAGVAFSPWFDGHTTQSLNNFNAVFPGALNILYRKDGKSLSYLHAVSTSNRFPILGPIARVEGVGSFVDGGYFENSGLLSLKNYYDELIQYDTTITIPYITECSTRVVQFINSKTNYVRFLIDSLGLDTKYGHKEGFTGQFEAIVGTAAGLDLLPYSLEQRTKQNFGTNHVQIFMPYPLEYSDFVQELGGAPNDPVIIDRILKCIERKNRIIEDFFDQQVWGIHQPPLARILGENAYNYMEYMLDHPHVKKGIERALADCN